ncbi:MAG: acetate--CoA ligase family protein [Desulfobacteraceae bacterium]|nr:acetate--CoA ligase family protein [Desulfobacteraceae bacterium]
MTKAQAKKLITQAKREGRTTLSEYEAKLVLAAYKIPVTQEILVEKKKELPGAARTIGYPLVMKGCAAEIAHKTEKNLVRVDVRNKEEALQAFEEIKTAMGDAQGGVLVQQMVSGRRELVMGLTRDPQFGACVMFGLGGIFTEILKDISFRKAPLEERDALEMMGDIKGHKILGAVRGMPAADTKALAKMLIHIGQIGLDLEAVAEIDLNPVILSGAKPVAVDALIVLR